MPPTRDLLFSSTLATAIACGVMAGVFFTFSTFVMKALGRLPAPEGIRAMQSINVYAVRSGFLVVFMGTALACLALTVPSIWRLDSPAGRLLLAGCAAYVIGGFLVTVVCNVPLNDRLAALDPNSAGAGDAWADYLVQWTRWNHLRTLACLAASVSLTLSLKLTERSFLP